MPGGISSINSTFKMLGPSWRLLKLAWTWPQRVKWNKHRENNVTKAYNLSSEYKLPGSLYFNLVSTAFFHQVNPPNVEKPWKNLGSSVDGFQCFTLCLVPDVPIFFQKSWAKGHNSTIKLIPKSWKSKPTKLSLKIVAKKRKCWIKKPVTHTKTNMLLKRKDHEQPSWPSNFNYYLDQLDFSMDSYSAQPTKRRFWPKVAWTKHCKNSGVCDKINGL